MGPRPAFTAVHAPGSSFTKRRNYSSGLCSYMREPGSSEAYPQAVPGGQGPGAPHFLPAARRSEHSRCTLAPRPWLGPPGDCLACVPTPLAWLLSFRGTSTQSLQDYPTSPRTRTQAPGGRVLAACGPPSTGSSWDAGVRSLAPVPQDESSASWARDLNVQNTFLYL